jgi:hypothetical protein
VQSTDARDPSHIRSSWFPQQFSPQGSIIDSIWMTNTTLLFFLYCSTDFYSGKKSAMTDSLFLHSIFPYSWAKYGCGTMLNISRDAMRCDGAVQPRQINQSISIWYAVVNSHPSGDDELVTNNKDVCVSYCVCRGVVEKLQARSSIIFTGIDPCFSFVRTLGFVPRLNCIW